MSHVKSSFLLLSWVFLASAASRAQTSDAARAKQPVATVDGQTIYDEDLAAAAQGQLQPLRNQEYEIKKKALDSLIEQRLLEAAAKKQGLTTEKLLVQEVDSKVPDPGDAEIEGYYLAQREKVNRPLDDTLRNQLRLSVKQAKTRQLREDYMKRLHSDSNVAILFSPPRVQVGYDPKRMRGNPKAPITIVEFSDYQCPYCHQVEAALKEVLAKYGDKVSLAYRDFPLTAIHSQAEIAAEASHCALEQGRFWQYHDQLFAASKLDKDALIDYARNLQLDDKQFGSCLMSEKYKAEIAKDSEDGKKAGVRGTPAFFINGITLSGAQPEDAFIRVIEDELGRAGDRPTATASLTPVGR